MLKSALLAKLNPEKKIKRKEPLKSAPLKKAIAKKIKTKTKLPPAPSPEEYEFGEEITEWAEKFRIEPTNVQKSVEGLIKFTSENPKLKNNLFSDEQFPIYIQINSFKVPRNHSRIARIPLKHSVFTPDSEICLIVADVKGIPNKSHEQHLEHYEKLLRQKGVNNVKKIMTFHEFRTDYETFELKNRLVELYDAFLVDGKISGKTVKKCGKIFYKKRKIPTAVKLRATKLKDHIDQTLRKTPLYLHSKGDSFMVQIGHSDMKVEELVENAYYVVNGLDKEFPGGFGNVRSLNLRAHRGLSIPIYTTLSK